MWWSDTEWPECSFPGVPLRWKKSFPRQPTRKPDYSNVPLPLLPQMTHGNQERKRGYYKQQLSSSFYCSHTEPVKRETLKTFGAVNLGEMHQLTHPLSFQTRNMVIQIAGFCHRQKLPMGSRRRGASWLFSGFGARGTTRWGWRWRRRHLDTNRKHQRN